MSSTMIGGMLVFIPAILIAVLSWARDLGLQARRTRALEEAKKHVEFWSLWLNTMEAVSPQNISSRGAIAEELASLGKFVRTLNPGGSSEPFLNYFFRLTALKKLLLWHRSPTLEFTTKRAIFYVNLVVLPGEMLFLAIRRNRFHSHLTARNWLGLLLTSALGFVLVSVFYSRAYNSLQDFIKGQLDDL